MCTRASVLLLLPELLGFLGSAAAAAAAAAAAGPASAAVRPAGEEKSWDFSTSSWSGMLRVRTVEIGWPGTSLWGEPSTLPAAAESQDRTRVNFVCLIGAGEEGRAALVLREDTSDGLMAGLKTRRQVSSSHEGLARLPQIKRQKSAAVTSADFNGSPETRTYGEHEERDSEQRVRGALHLLQEIDKL
ncbi:uncharacterized protein B0I36DRAFT_435567 [Microdochium trichocladiopsis]|uniref:Uncharacterized protein n=1 Tax=Microdochium trichocladiopsis TaxID=1682393 RepID=A0A9P8XWD1_9PEZI|nr:uncharacterized protein B0I36DRAFT_435567 [Microdochium trichocladiopsis]KAH7018214.1 hypothetical protein B0I36DRAFT_435567 [Microdochium trichocladiopsis]